MRYAFGTATGCRFLDDELKDHHSNFSTWLRNDQRLSDENFKCFRDNDGKCVMLTDVYDHDDSSYQFFCSFATLCGPHAGVEVQNIF